MTDESELRLRVTSWQDGEYFYAQVPGGKPFSSRSRDKAIGYALVDLGEAYARGLVASDDANEVLPGDAEAR